MTACHVIFSLPCHVSLPCQGQMLGREKCFARNTTSSQRDMYIVVIMKRKTLRRTRFLRLFHEGKLAPYPCSGGTIFVLIAQLFRKRESLVCIVSTRKHCPCLSNGQPTDLAVFTFGALLEQTLVLCPHNDDITCK